MTRAPPPAPRLSVCLELRGHSNANIIPLGRDPTRAGEHVPPGDDSIDKTNQCI